ncbi:uncharacterized protein LOC129716607 [Wyeomyia smithii]|uniref:uncharacterized protein LOC129716607 n=1 Tax=Wyeomyia smithii TaxID=174621 RepID=UPI002467C629|nr:uncharacterized protein LOC129716607 [Wyeomyia smithii]
MDKHIESLNNLPRVTKENTASMRKLIDICTKNVEALKNLALPVTGLGEQILLNQITSKLDKTTRMAWESRQKKGVYPNYEATIEFLQEQCRILEKVDINVKPAAESVKAKSVALKKWGNCFNCLQRGHRTNGCSSSRNCRDCGKRHHTVLHNDSSSTPAQADSATCKNDASQATQNSNKRIEDVKQQSAVSLCVSTANDSKQILLSTAVMMVHGDSSALYPCRVLLDSASQMHFVTERFANLLSQRKEPVDYLVSGLNGSNTRLRNMIRTTIQSCNGGFATELQFLVALRITGDVPSKSFDISNWPIPSGIEWADPAFNKRGRIDMLIGAEIFWDLVKDDRITLAYNLPVLIKTELGWIAGGVLTEQSAVLAHSFCQIANEERLEDLLKCFHRLESCDEINTSRRNDQEC